MLISKSTSQITPTDLRDISRIFKGTWLQYLVSIARIYIKCYFVFSNQSHYSGVRAKELNGFLLGFKHQSLEVK